MNSVINTTSHEWSFRQRKCRVAARGVVAGVEEKPSESFVVFLFIGEGLWDEERVSVWWCEWRVRDVRRTQSRGRVCTVWLHWRWQRDNFQRKASGAMCDSCSEV